MRRLLMLIGILLAAGAVFAGPDPNALPYPSQTSLSLNHSNVFFSPQVSSPPIQFQNQGTPLGVSFTFNCSTGLSCSFVSGVMTVTASGGGGTINPGTTGDAPNYSASTTLSDSGILFDQPDADSTSIAIGASALGSQSSTSLHNLAIGTSALGALTTGSQSVAVGYQAIQGVAADRTTTNNTAVGYQALTFPGSSSNTAIGQGAGANLRSGGQDVFVGDGTSSAVNSDTNEVVIGHATTGAGSNTATIGNASLTDHFVGGATGLAYENSAGFIDRGSTPTITGTGACATVSTQSGGATAGTVTCTGSTGASTLTITFAKTAPHGWTCDVWDETTRADNPSQTSHSQTTCVVTATAIAANDVLVFKAFAW